MPWRCTQREGSERAEDPWLLCCVVKKLWGGKKHISNIINDCNFWIWNYFGLILSHGKLLKTLSFLNSFCLLIMSIHWILFLSPFPSFYLWHPPTQTFHFCVYADYLNFFIHNLHLLLEIHFHISKCFGLYTYGITWSSRWLPSAKLLSKIKLIFYFMVIGPSLWNQNHVMILALSFLIPHTSNWLSIKYCQCCEPTSANLTMSL